MPRIGFFTRLLETGTAGERYRWALEQIQQAERCGFSSAWVAQHHFNAKEGGLPTPWPLLGAAAQATSRIRLGTAVVTLPHENPIRTAEDAAVVDVLSGGRFEFGVAPGASPQALEAFGYGGADVREMFAQKFAQLRAALRGEPIGEAGFTLQPLPSGLDERIWQATFSVSGAERAGRAGDGLMLSRIQPGSRPGDRVGQQQLEMIEAYLAQLPEGSSPRILASRTAVVVDEKNRQVALKHLRTRVAALAERNLKVDAATLSDEQLLAYTNTYFGTVEEVTEQLGADEAAARSTEVSFQVHSLDPGHELTLRSIELLGTEVAPRLGWTVES
ncbi:LLM class flavin-dependent oxidoreductase [Nesterenkonia flava]|uniref:LLM class flavin-dependent oxidoreductase n=1 Tax=Nesterenkonia flava TaxID=469799 RepID=A0ABU1FRC4_9MICC|nr:LLM class flavin-dependent oxidoreductase [Nesterenkonia flava]MDR5711205.1 LLM class flavin-dependent oxidoreductase [Nesterenkonia flava]